LKSILAKCEPPDFQYISEVLDNYVSFTDDSGRKELLSKFDASGDAKSKKQLVAVIDKQIRYFGSSEIAYVFRSVFSDDAGVPAKEIIDDVCEKLKVTVKVGGSVEARLERLVKAVVEKELLSKTPEELRKAFRDFGIGEAKTEHILDFIKKNGKVAVLPILLEIAGPVITMTIIQAIVISLITALVGREAAKAILKEIIKRNPWLNALGPVVWAISGGWLAFDLQGPAYRKTAPICLYLGIVALRDGPIDGPSFFAAE
jgi:uncharacterized protein YaaW (UPF0174 family)